MRKPKPQPPRRRHPGEPALPASAPPRTLASRSRRRPSPPPGPARGPPPASHTVGPPCFRPLRLPHSRPFGLLRCRTLGFLGCRPFAPPGSRAAGPSDSRAPELRPFALSAPGQRPMHPTAPTGYRIRFPVRFRPPPGGRIVTADGYPQNDVRDWRGVGSLGGGQVWVGAPEITARGGRGAYGPETPVPAAGARDHAAGGFLLSGPVWRRLPSGRSLTAHTDEGEVPCTCRAAAGQACRR